MASSPSATGRSLALVTGASSGIGRAYAECLAAAGHDLVVVARRGDRLESLKHELESSYGVSVEMLIVDLASGSGMEQVEAIAADSRLEIVVDNAALGHYMSFLELPLEKAEELVSLNVLSPVRLIRAALPGMVERGKGTVVSIASQVVFSATSDNPQLPERAVYAATKAFLFTFVRLLALELRQSGVRIQVVCPGVVKTEFHSRQNIDMSHMPRLEPEQVVAASMRALELGEIVCNSDARRHRTTAAPRPIRDRDTEGGHAADAGKALLELTRRNRRQRAAIEVRSAHLLAIVAVGCGGGAHGSAHRAYASRSRRPRSTSCS